MPCLIFNTLVRLCCRMFQPPPKGDNRPVLLMNKPTCSVPPAAQTPKPPAVPEVTSTPAPAPVVQQGEWREGSARKQKARSQKYYLYKGDNVLVCRGFYEIMSVQTFCPLTERHWFYARGLQQQNFMTAQWNISTDSQIAALCCGLFWVTGHHYVKCNPSLTCALYLTLWKWFWHITAPHSLKHTLARHLLSHTRSLT